jgi:NADPH:quinone reductase
VVSHERALAAIPDGLPFEEAAAIPEAFVTAHDAIVTQANLRGGEALLVHAVGSGVGTAAAQLGRALGAIVVGTARTPDKLARVDLDHGIVPDGGKFADAVRAACGGAAVTLELVGGAYLDEDLRAAAPRGRIVLVGLLAGAKTELDLGLILRKRLQITGTVLRSRALEDKIAAMRAFEAQVVPLLARGKLRAVVDRVLPLDAAADAHRHMASNASVGKIVLRV